MRRGEERRDMPRGVWSRCARLVMGASLVVLGGCTALAPLTQLEIFQRVETDRNTIRAAASAAAASQRFVENRPLELSDAIAHALAHNLDIRLAQLDSVIARGNLDLSDLSKLPSLLVSAGYTFRSPAGASTDKIPGDSYRNTNSVELSLGALDFGQAYLRAKGDANTALMADERRKRTANGIINDVRLAFWQARMGELRRPQLRDVVAQINDAIESSRRVAASGLQDPLVALTYQEGLLELRRQIDGYEAEVEAAKARLARLLNLPPTTRLVLAGTPSEASVEALAAVKRETLEDYALATRTELRELDYGIRNRRIDIQTAYLSMLPPLRLRLAHMGDSTSSLAANSWHEEGFSVAWNVIGIFTALQRAELGRRNLASNELRRLALSLSVLEQVELTRTQVGAMRADYRLAQQQSELRERIFDIRRTRLPFGDNDELERVRAAISAVAALIREDRAYAALQKAYGDMLTAIGIDQFPPGLDPGAEKAAADLDAHLKMLPAVIASLTEQMARAPSPEIVTAPPKEP